MRKTYVALQPCGGGRWVVLYHGAGGEGRSAIAMAVQGIPDVRVASLATLDLVQPVSNPQAARAPCSSQLATRQQKSPSDPTDSVQSWYRLRVPRTAKPL